MIITQYDRPALFGGKDHVVQYTIPAGTTLYRLVGITPADQIDKSKEVFAHVAASFRPMYDRDPRSSVHPVVASAFRRNDS